MICPSKAHHPLRYLICIFLSQPAHWNRVPFLYQKLDEDSSQKRECIFVAYRIQLEITSCIPYLHYSPHDAIFSNTGDLDSF